ncbi:hypothetical protein ACEPAH_8967 [Sanghuangporus vaninii]
MTRSSTFPLLLALRRRTRPAALCLAVLILITISLLGSNSPSYRPSAENMFSTGRLSKYLSIVSLQTSERPQRTTGAQDQQQQQLQAEPTLIDNISEIPPTFLDNVDLRPGTRKKVSGFQSHTYKKNGLLIVNPDAPHPIYELIRHAETEWESKMRRSSRTLKQAVREYKRRYSRLPPKGFDKWWDYVQKHDIQLPDEYDQIHHDLEPYWGIDPRDLQEVQAEREGKSDSFTIGKLEENEIISLVNITVDASREHRIKDYMSWGVKPQLEMLNEVYQHIPPFRATFSPSDGPSELVDWTWRNAAIAAAKRGTYLKPEDLPTQESSGWSGACPSDSPLYLNPLDRNEEPTSQTSKTFIHNHRASMDPCYHPQHIITHGTFLPLGAGPKPQRFPAPLVSNCASPLHADIRATSMAQSSEFAHEDPRWEDKDDDRLFWRGTPTGMWHHQNVNWRASQRVRLVNITRTAAAGHMFEWEPEPYISFLDPTPESDEPVGEAGRHARRRVNRALMDVSFSGPVTGCEGIVCDTMASQLSWSSHVPSDAHGAGRYKYVLDVDGNGWSNRFRRLMSSNALVFKSTLFPEWWTDRAQAWVHYIPVQLDYSDLYDSLVFFGGDLGGEGAHDDMAYNIAIAGRQWVERFWREEDVTAYMFRLWLEYARVMSLDRDMMSYDLPLES